MKTYYSTRSTDVVLEDGEANKLILDLKERLISGKIYIKYSRPWRRLEVIKKGWFTDKVLGSLSEGGEWLEIIGKGGYKTNLDVRDLAPVLKGYADKALKDYARSEIKKVLG